MFRLLLLFCCLYVSCYGQPASLLLSKHTRRLYIITRFFFLSFSFSSSSLFSALASLSEKCLRVLKLERNRKKKKRKRGLHALVHFKRVFLAIWTGWPSRPILEHTPTLQECQRCVCMFCFCFQ